MNRKTKAFLTQFAALCDAYGVDFAPEIGVSFTSTDESATDRIEADLYNLKDLKAQLAQD